MIHCARCCSIDWTDPQHQESKTHTMTSAKSTAGARAGNASQAARVSLRQQLESDRMLGIPSVPMHAPPIPQTPRRSALNPVVSDPDKEKQLQALNEAEVRNCKQCPLCKTRTQTVFGQGNANARLVFVGEAPGYEEDKQGLAFVGKAGQLLARMIGAMGLSRDEVFICNVLKCRPPNNRDPSADEILKCSPFLQRQLAIIQPEIIVALGAPAAKTLLNTAQPIGKLRGRFHEFHFVGSDVTIPVMPTYHPAYLLRSPEEKRKTWNDLQIVMRDLGLETPKENND